MIAAGGVVHGAPNQQAGQSARVSSGHAGNDHASEAGIIDRASGNGAAAITGGVSDGNGVAAVPGRAGSPPIESDTYT